MSLLLPRAYQAGSCVCYLGYDCAQLARLTNRFFFVVTQCHCPRFCNVISKKKLFPSIQMHSSLWFCLVERNHTLFIYLIFACFFSGFCYLIYPNCFYLLLVLILTFQPAVFFFSILFQNKRQPKSDFFSRVPCSEIQVKKKTYTFKTVHFFNGTLHFQILYFTEHQRDTLISSLHRHTSNLLYCTLKTFVFILL